MTDQELLELAAKAADLEINFDDLLDCGGYTVYGNNTEHKWWNPLTDDGDALRLAVKLSIHVTYYDKACTATSDGFISEIMYNDDPYAATRRAIVRAAAEIGKAMK